MGLGRPYRGDAGHQQTRIHQQRSRPGQRGDQTFAVGETVPEWCNHTSWFFFNHATATCGVPLNYRIEQGSAFLASAHGDWSRNYSFFSRHPGGGSFAFVDGSVAFIQDSIAIDVYRQLATISGGESVSP
ncbi:MAG: DUF1559 domain-containing protein [Planctomycetia bacterium]|nr:DUF1559 domain-containing protein [Planctomycetia bacterium]